MRAKPAPDILTPLAPLVVVADGDVLEEEVAIVEVTLVVSLVRPRVVVEAVSSEEEGIGPPGMIALDAVTTVVPTPGRAVSLPTGAETIGVAREAVDSETEATGPGMLDSIEIGRLPW